MKMFRTNSKKGVVNVLAIVLTIAVLAAVSVYFYSTFVAQEATIVEADISALTEGQVVAKNAGEISTVTFTRWDLTPEVRTKVTGTPNGNAYEHQDGQLYQIYDNEPFASVRTTVGRSLTIFGFANKSLRGGGNVYYCDPKQELYVSTEAPNVELDCFKAAATTSMTLTVFDGMNSELSKAGNIADEAGYMDYNISLGASAQSAVQIKIKNEDSDSVAHVKAICYRSRNDADDLTIEDNDWKKGIVPKFLTDTKININNTGAAAYTETGGYETCFYYKGINTEEVVELFEWDSILIDGTLTASSTGCAASAVASTYDTFHVQIVDGDYFGDSSGWVSFGINDDGDDEANVGWNESVEDPKGGTIGVNILCSA